MGGSASNIQGEHRPDGFSTSVGPNYHLLGISPPIPERCVFRTSIAEMQRMHMTALQKELVDLGIQLR